MENFKNILLSGNSRLQNNISSANPLKYVYIYLIYVEYIYIYIAHDSWVCVCVCVFK